jgi:hypothetical protein
MKLPSRPLAVAGLAALLAVLPPTDSQAGLYGITFFDNQLTTIDTTTGAGTLVGPLASPMSPFGLATVNNQLYTFDSSADVIRQLNPATGGTQATFNIGIGPVLGQGGLAFQSGTVGFLTSALDPTTLVPVNDLYRFDIGAGTSVLVGHTADTLEALAFSPGGTLYALGKLDGDLYIVNPTTAGMTLVGNTGVAVGSPTGGLAFGPNGTLYATLDDALYTLNTTTGAATPVNPDPTTDTGFSSISGLAFLSVPEPSSVVLMALGLAGACGAALGRSWWIRR